MTKVEDLDLDTLKFVAKRINRIHNWGSEHHISYEGFGIPKTLTNVQLMKVLVARKSGKRDPQVFSKELMELIIDDKKYHRSR